MHTPTVAEHLRAANLDDIRALLRSGNQEIDLAIVRSRLREPGSLVDDSTLVGLFDQQVTATKRQRARR